MLTMLTEKMSSIARGAAGNWIFFNGALYSYEAWCCFVANNSSSSNNSNQQQPQPEESIIYEVVRWRNGRPCWAPQHAQRMANSLDTFKYGATSNAAGQREGEAEAAASPTSFKNDPEWNAAFQRLLRTVAERNNVTEQNIKVVVWRNKAVREQAGDALKAAGRTDDDGNDNNTSTTTTASMVELPDEKMPPLATLPSDFNWCGFTIKSFYPPADWYERGTDVAVMLAQRPDPHSKVPMPEMRSRAEQMQKDHNVFEVLLQRPSDGVLTEGSRSNFLLIQKQQAAEQQEGEQPEKKGVNTVFDGYTVVQSLDEDVLLGITRETVNQICAKHGIKMVKRQIKQEDIVSPATVGMALTGTSLGVLPVKTVATFSGENGETKSVKKLTLESDDGDSKIVPALSELQRLYVAYRDGEMIF